MGLVGGYERRRWARRVRHCFAPDERVVAYGRVKTAGGETTGMMLATQYALYHPHVSPDVRIEYADIAGAAFEQPGAGTAGLLRLDLPELGRVEYEVRAPRDFVPFVVDRVGSTPAR